MMDDHEIPPLSSVTSSFSDFFQESPFGMKVLDRENHILYANAVTQASLGRSQEELRQMKELDLIHPIDLYGFRERFRGVARGQAIYAEVEARHRHADGHWVPMLVHHLRLPPSGWPDR